MRIANRIRSLLDRVFARVGSVATVGLLGGLTAAAGAWQLRAIAAPCGDLPVDLVRLEVAFRATEFKRLLDAEGACRGQVVWSFISYDAIFPFCYGAFLCALFVWTERWRRFRASDKPCECEASSRRDLVVIAPLAAAALDLIFENLPLWYAANATVGAGLAVAVGSLAATVKWLLVLFTVLGIGVELMSGPRGAVLWRARFSALAVAIGAVPLLLIPQGQDILQRLFEGDFPRLRILTALFAPVFAAFAVWYSARQLLELSFRNESTTDQTGWYEFFAEQIPRVLGISLLVLVGLAFARAGLAQERFIIAGALGFVGAIALRRVAPRLFRAIGERPGRQLAIAAALGALVFVPHRFPGDPGGFRWWPEAGNLDEHVLLYLRFASYLCAVAAWLFQLFVVLRHSPDDTRRRVGSIDARRAGSVVSGRLLTAAAISLFFLLAFTYYPVEVGRTLGPLWILSLATVNAVVIGSVCVWAGKRYDLPVVATALLLALLFSVWNDNHAVRTLDSAPRARAAVQQQFDRWIAAVPGSASSTPVPVVFVAGAGGGLRAAYWTARALALLQDEAPTFADHLFAFSGVSGGSLGGALFAALARDQRASPLPCGTYSTCVMTFMDDDFLSPVLAKLVAPDFLQWFLPIGVGAFDRSLAFEAAWERSYEKLSSLKTFEQGFTALERPALFFNSTHVETGRRYVTGSLVARDTSVQAHRFLDARDILDVTGRDLALSTAAHNSSRFTYISPAGHLASPDTSEAGHIVDGGYFENSGLATLREVVDLVGERGNVRRLVLYLCNDPRPCALETAAPPRTDTIASAAADEMLSPIRALLKTRDARGSLARAHLSTMPGVEFIQLNVCDELPVAALQRVDPQQAAGQEKTPRIERAQDRVISPPLGWLLSRQARRWMDESLKGNRSSHSSQSSQFSQGADCYSRNASAIRTLVDALEPARP